MIEKKYFIITAGATGSGKTKLITETLKHLSLDENSPVTKILIDDLVENDPTYKEKIKEIISKIDEDCKKGIDNKGNNTECKKNNTDCKVKNTSYIDDCEKEIFKNPSKELYKSFSDAYFDTRKVSGCGKIKQINKSCDDKIDMALIQIKETKPKIVVFEFTGQYIPIWLLKNTDYIPIDYIIVLAYSIVTIDNLVERNKDRSYKSIVEFKANNTKPAPRLPDVSKEAFGTIISTIRTTLINLYDNCIKNNYKDIDKIKCGDRQINRLLLFDNNKTEFKKIYDYDNTKPDSLISKEDFIKIIDSSFGNVMIGGKNKKYRKSNKYYIKSKKYYIKRKITYKTKKINKKHRKL